MSEKQFVLSISSDAFAATIKKIGKELKELKVLGVHAGVREMDAVLSDVLQGIPDSVLLTTSLNPSEVDRMLTERLGADFEYCTLKWL